LSLCRLAGTDHMGRVEVVNNMPASLDCSCQYRIEQVTAPSDPATAGRTCA
jgi:hypothetical protein